MPRYIDIDAEIEKMKNAVIEKKREGTDDEFTNRIFDVIINAFNKVPTADVQEVKHGRWERTDDGAARCTSCERKMYPYLYGYKHCPLCGAIMDGKRIKA